MEKLNIEEIQFDNIRYAEVIWADTQVETTRFFSPASSSFQFGLLAHKAGFKEAAHFHKSEKRVIADLQQMFVVQKGVVDVELYSNDLKLIKVVRLKQGDAIVLIDGIHAINVIEDMQCLSVKQGPFLGDANDKIFVDIK